MDYYEARYDHGPRNLDAYYGREEEDVIVHQSTEIQNDRKRMGGHKYNTGFDEQPRMQNAPINTRYPFDQSNRQAPMYDGRRYPGPPVQRGPTMNRGQQMNGHMNGNAPPKLSAYERAMSPGRKKHKYPSRDREFSPRRGDRRNRMAYNGNVPDGMTPYPFADDQNMPQGFNDRHPVYEEEPYGPWARPSRVDNHMNGGGYPKAMSDIGGVPSKYHGDLFNDKPTNYGEREIKVNRDDYNAATKRNLAVWSNWRTAMNERILDGGHRGIPDLDTALHGASSYDFDTPVRVDDPKTLMKYATAANEGTGLYADDFVNYGIPRVEVNEKNAAIKQLDPNLERGRPRDKKNNMIKCLVPEQQGRRRRERSYDRAPLSREAETAMYERRAMSPPPRFADTAAAYERQNRNHGNADYYGNDEDIYGALHSNMLNELTQSLNRNRPARRF